MISIRPDEVIPIAVQTMIYLPVQNNWSLTISPKKAYSKQLSNNMSHLARGPVDQLPFVCAIMLRKNFTLFMDKKRILQSTCLKYTWLWTPKFTLKLVILASYLQRVLSDEVNQEWFKSQMQTCVDFSRMQNVGFFSCSAVLNPAEKP